MKNPNRDIVSKLEELPNIGKAMLSDLRLIGIEKPKDLIGKNPFYLHNKLCIKKEKELSSCVIDLFMTIINFMEAAQPPWWEFTEKQKLILKKEEFNV